MRRIARAGPLAWVFTGWWVAVAAMVVALEGRDHPGAAALVGVLAVLLIGRTARCGIVARDGELRCATWFRTLRVPAAEVVQVRAVGYAGFASEFATSGYLAVPQVRLRSGRTVTLRALVARASRVKRVTRGVEEHCRAAAVPA